VYNIKKAVSRLDFAPKIEAIEIIDIKQGLGKFTPKPAKAASFAALKETLKKAGYKLDSAEITVIGTLMRDEAGWWMEIAESKQRFALEGDSLRKLSVEAATGARFKVTGDWRTIEQGKTNREVIGLSAMQKIAFDGNRSTSNPAGLQSAKSRKTFLSTVNFASAKSLAVAPPGKLKALKLPEQNVQPGARPPLQGKTMSVINSYERLPLPAFTTAENVVADSPVSPDEANAEVFFAPIRTTSPGLTVYRGGGFMPRYSYTKQHLGNLEVRRQSVNLSLSYTPTSTLQLEAQLPYAHTAFKDGLKSGAGQGFGNLTLWGKYRFYRTLETWGDKQAAMRFGVELPTGKKDAPVEAKLNAPAFVRQQLTPINNGWAAHLDTSFSQARQRWIYGANLEATVRAERAGFRLGHEIRLNTDLEYILLPFKYRSPTKELFLIFETTYFHRGDGRVGGAKVARSQSDEFHIAPGLQYIASQRFILEASYQLPVLRNTGALVLRTDSNFLFGVRYLY
jgi:hypothetical protein